MAVNIKASFTKETRPLNGLEAILDQLLEKPYEEHYVICKVRNARSTKDHENGGTETPTVNFFHIEPMLSDKDEQDAKKLFEQACKARLGDLPQKATLEKPPQQQDIPQQPLFADGTGDDAEGGEQK